MTNLNTQHRRSVTKMFRLVVSAIVIALLSSECHGFTSPVVPSNTRIAATTSTSTQLEAVSIPVPRDGLWGGSGAVPMAPRGSSDRIQQVLARAKSRTGVPVYTPTTSPTTTVVKNPKDATSAAPALESDLPFALPQLSEQQMLALQEGEIVQEQSEMGRQGSGFVVQDVQGTEEAVWNCLLDIDSYVDNIRTVRSMKRLGAEEESVVQYGSPSSQRACFTVSKFQLQIATVLKYQPHPDGHYMEMTLDNSLSNAVLQSAKGIWYTQRISNNVTRLWLLCDLTVSPMLPPFIVDSAATKAMPHASTWVRPTLAAAQAVAASAY